MDCSLKNPLITFAFLAVIFVRISPIMTTDFPLNDGGMFYTMINDLKSNNYRLPIFTSYNQAQIPFVYPPLALYFAALLSDILPITALTAVKWLPAIFSVFTIPALFWLAKTLLNSQPMAVISTVAYGLMPQSFEWQIMGGGLTRSLGLLFSLLALRFALDFYRNATKYNSLSTIICLSLALLSHPEAGWFVFYSLFLFFLFTKSSRKKILPTTLLIITTAAFTSPWWLTVLQNHGITPWIAALKTGGNWLASIYYLLTFEFASQPLLDIFGVLGLLGLAVSLATKAFLLPSWVLIILSLNSRSSYRFVVIPFSILSGIALYQFISLTRKKITPYFRETIGQQKHFSKRQKNSISDYNQRASNWILGVIWFYGSISALILPKTTDSKLVSVSRSERAAMLWVKQHTSPDSRFLVIPKVDNINWAVENSAEWFPALAARVNVSTVQGYEWLPSQFTKRIANSYRLRSCLNQSVECLKNWQRETGLAFSYIFLSKQPRAQEATDFCDSVLECSLRNSPEYKSVFQNTRSEIFRYQPEHAEMVN